MNESTKRLSVRRRMLCILFCISVLVVMIVSAEIALPAAAEDRVAEGEIILSAETPSEAASQVDLFEEEIVSELPLAESEPAQVVFDKEEIAPSEAEEISAAEATSSLSETQELAALTIASFIVDCLRYDVDNVDASVVADATFFSGYDGQLVFFGDWKSGRSGSFGRLMGVHLLSKGSRSFSELLKHEHGHYEQFLEIGLLKYIFAIAIPSMANDPVDYYSQPWEVTADLLGGVTTHYHAPGSEAAGVAYLNNVKNADLFSVILGRIGA